MMMRRLCVGEIETQRVDKSDSIATFIASLKMTNKITSEEEKMLNIML